MGTVLFGPLVFFVDMLQNKSNSIVSKKQLLQDEKRELQYITAIIRNYPREDILLAKGSILRFLNKIIKIDRKSLDDMHFNVRVASLLKEQMEIIMKEGETTGLPLDKIKKLLQNADVAECEDYFGFNKDLEILQNKVLEVCGATIIEAAKKEYAFICSRSDLRFVHQYLDDLEKVEIFRRLQIKDILFESTKQLEIIT